MRVGPDWCPQRELLVSPAGDCLAGRLPCWEPALWLHLADQIAMGQSRAELAGMPSYTWQLFRYRRQALFELSVSWSASCPLCCAPTMHVLCQGIGWEAQHHRVIWQVGLKFASRANNYCGFSAVHVKSSKEFLSERWGLNIRNVPGIAQSTWVYTGPLKN